MLGNEPAQLEEVPEKGATGCAARFTSGCAFGVSKIMQKSTESDPAFLSTLTSLATAGIATTCIQ